MKRKPISSKMYDPDYVRALIPTMTEQIVQYFNPSKIVLFGSYANGTPTWQSDIDIMVVMDKVKHFVYDAIEIKKVIGHPEVAKDIVVISTSDLERVKDDVGYVYYYAIRYGVVLYER